MSKLLAARTKALDKVDTTPTRDIDPGNYIFEVVQFMPVQHLDKDIPPSIINVDAGLRGNLEVNLVEKDFNMPCVVQHGANMRSHTDNEPKDDVAKDFKTLCVIQHGTNVRWHTNNGQKDGVKNAKVAAEIQSVIDAYKEIDMDDDFMDSGPVGKPVGTEVIVYNANKMHGLPTSTTWQNFDHRTHQDGYSSPRTHVCTPL
ncbi:uncharacterized protein LOC121764913 isoform X2 [Salvia splendens]|uniref:uncharacterized protein LOC121764913 isoform X2 n=1 Tax=Salvia splendens TaxID=180675 RepID=UPI001C279F5A|nr:uncharacterized protein LOC121764913 isoform X2 [Salvia splendens]